MINSRKSVTAITILLLISSVIGGCFGNENEEVYSGPIDIVLILSADSGTLEISKGNGNETIDQQTNSVEIEFDLSNTTSGSGEITGFTIDPGDGSDMIYSNGSESGVFTHEYLVHGVFEAIITAIDSEENERTVTEEIRIDYIQEHNNQNTNNPDVVWIDYIGPSKDIPMWINVSSTIANPQDFEFGPIGSNEPVTVTWTLYDGQDNKVNETTETLEGGGSMDVQSSINMPITIDWRVEITLDNDENVNAVTIFAVNYDHSEM